MDLTRHKKIGDGLKQALYGVREEADDLSDFSTLSRLRKVEQLLESARSALDDILQAEHPEQPYLEFLDTYYSARGLDQSPSVRKA